MSWLEKLKEIFLTGTVHCPTCGNELIQDPEGWSSSSVGPASGPLYDCNSCNLKFVRTSRDEVVPYKE